MRKIGKGKELTQPIDYRSIGVWTIILNVRF